MDGNVLSDNYYQHCLDREITYPEANIQVKAIDAYTLEITADTFAKGVFLQCGGTDRIFSDNFFNLVKGERKIVTSTEAMDVKNLTVQSVNQVKFIRKGEQ